MTVKPLPIPAEPTRHERLWLAGPRMLEALHIEFFRLFNKAAQGLDAEEVHDLRVASRRLREGLDLFRPILPRKRARFLSNRIKELTRLLGELRNADEAALFFAAIEPRTVLVARPEAKRLQEELAAEGKRIRVKLEKELKRFDAASLQDGFERLLAAPNPFKKREADPFLPFRLFAAGAFAKRSAQTEALLPAALHEEDAAARHRLRIAVKKLRYRLEIVAPLLPDAGEEERRTLKRYQDLLGELHDLDVFTGLVAERVATVRGREELLEVIRKRRGERFASFMELEAERPLSALSAHVTQRLAPP